MPGPILVVAGPPGAGKTTVSRLVARSFTPLGCVLESDFWWTTIVNGFVPPWQPAAHDQNRTVVRSFAAAAAALAAGGYAVVVDGIVGPWNLDLVRAAASSAGADLHYVVLRPPLAIALDRASGRAGEERVPGHPALTDEEPIRKLWHEFAALAEYERHVVDNGDFDAAQTAAVVWTMVEEGRAHL